MRPTGMPCSSCVLAALLFFVAEPLVAQTTESNGTVRIEAEVPSSSPNISRTVTDPVNGITNTYTWTASTAIGGFSGTGLMQVLPNDAMTVTSGWTAASPELRYTVNFTNTGTYYVWVRGYAESAESVSVYVGLDGASPAAAQIDLPKTGAWSWSNKAAGSAVPVAITVPTAGAHTLNIWMRDAGFALDKIILTLNARYSPEYSADFWRNQSVYQIITDRFFDADPSNNSLLPNYNQADGGQAHGGDFKGIEKKLDYIKALGATAIWISPVVKNANGDYHGYAATDFYAVNPRMGTLTDLQRLVAEAHKRGILVINDVVVNHGSTWVDSGDAGWSAFKYPPTGYNLRYNSGGQQYAAPFANTNLTQVFGNTSLSNIFHNNGGTANWADATQVELGELASLDDFRTESSYVRTKMKEIWSYWINAAGFDAYRIDTVKHVEMGFWDEWTPVVRAAAAAADKPNFFMFGEVFDGSDSKCGSYTGTKSGGNYKMDSVLDYPMYYQVGSVFASASGSTGQIESRYGNLSTLNYDASALNSLVLNLDNHDNPRFLSTGIGGNTARLEVALAFLYTSRGIPSLYYGTEQDFDGGADPWCREDMFDGQFEGGPSNGDNFNMTGARFKLVAKLNNLRRLYPALRTGSHDNLWANYGAPGLLAYARRLNGEEVYVVLNTAGSSQTIGARPTIHPAGTVLVNVLNPAETYTVTTGTDGIPSITMPASSYKMFVAQSQVKALSPVVDTVAPAHDATGISPASTISVTFDRAMNPTTTQEAFSTVPATTGTFTWSAGNTVMTYKPSSNMAGTTLYGVRIESTATDANGLAMFAPFESRFTTGAASTTAKPSVNSVTYSGVTTSGATLGATVTPNGATTTVLFEYGTTASYGLQTTGQGIGSGSSSVASSATLSGLLPGTTYHFRIVAANSVGTTYGADTTFTTDALLPLVTTTPASYVTTSSASLNGDVNPNGLPTSIWFEYGVKSDTLTSVTPAQDAGSAAVLAGKWASISGLTPETTYYFRIVAQTGTSVVHGSVLSFTTASVKPTLSAVAAQNVVPTGATLTATVSPNGDDSTAWFEYGSDTTYGSTTAVQNVAGSSAAPAIVTADLSGLIFGKTYHFRAVAQNSFGTTYGADQTFTTSYPPPSVTTGPVTATTTNSASLSGTVNPNGPETIYWFEYGTTAAYGSSTKAGASDDIESYTTTTLVYSSTSAGATNTVNGGTGFGRFTSYVRTTAATSTAPSRGGIRCVTTNSINGTDGRQIDGNNSLGVYAGSSTTSGTHSGYRALTTAKQFGQVKFSARFDISNAKGFTGVNLKSANGTTFSANELISVGIMPASGTLGGNTALVVTDASGQRNIDLGAEVRGAVVDIRIDFDTKAGTYTCGAKFRADADYKTISGTLKLSGASVSLTTLGYINGNNTGEAAQHMILDGLQFVSAASAGTGLSPVAVAGSLSGLTPNTTYHYRAVAQNSIGQTAGADAVFFTGGNAAPTISNISDQTTNKDTATGSIAFTVGDIETAAGSLTVTGSSSNPSLVPNANILFGGSGANRTLTITPAAGKTGTATITVTVSDGALTATDTFLLTVNAPPTISTIPTQTINEGATGEIAFTVGDAETAAGTLTITATSSNQALVPDANIVVGGSGTSRTVTVTPAANAYGTATIAVTVNDGYATASSSFVLTVDAVNDPPTIGSIANQVVTAGAATPAIAFSVADVDTPVASLVTAATSSNQELVPDANIAVEGAGAERTVTITPVAGQSGTATITLMVSDGALSASTNFIFTVNAPPTVSAIAAQVIDEDTATGAIAFTVGDAETAATALTVTATSSDEALVPDSNIVLGGSGADRTVTVTPAANANGTATITVTVSDGQASTSSNFLLTVNAVNDAPTISSISAQGVTANSATGAIAFTIGDVETSADSLTMGARSSDTTLIPEANIVFGGSGANRTVIVTPAADQTGMATITLTVSDGELTTERSFILTVAQNNHVPTISNIPDQTVLVGASTGAIAFTVGDAETALSALTLTAGSSNTALVPNANIAFGGSGADRTVTVTPASGQTGTAAITVTVSDGTLTASDTFVVTVNQPPDITVELSPGSDAATNLAYSGGSFIGQNGGYGYGSWTGAATGFGGTYLDTATNGLKSFAIYAGGGTGNSYTASRAFNTPMAVGETFTVQLGYTTVNSGGDVGMKLYSGGQLRLTLHLAPSTLTRWQLNDGGSDFSTGISRAAGTPLYVTFTRNAGNGYSIKLNSGTQVLNGTNYTSTSGVMSIDRVDFYSTAQGSNQNFRFANIERFIPAAAAGTPAFDFGTVRVAAAGNWLTYVVRNDGTGPLSGLSMAKSGTNNADFNLGALGATTLAAGEKTTFQVTFNPTGQGVRSAFAAITSNDPDENPFAVSLAGTGLNDAPAIGNIPDQAVNENTGTGPIAFIVGDVETPGSLAVTASSSNKTLIPDENITLGGSGSDRTIAVTPADNQNGTATITVTVSDGDRTVTETFVVTVSPLNGTPTISAIADQTVSADTATAPIGFTVGDSETPADQLVVTAKSDNLTLVPDDKISLGGAGADRTIVVTPATGQSGTANITVTVDDGTSVASRTFLLTVRATSGFGAWSVLSSLPADLRGPTDRNGPLAIPNLVAYAMGLDPLTATPADLPASGKESNKLSITFHRSRFATDVTIDVEAADSVLGGWTSIWSSATNSYAGGTNAIESVTVQDSVPMDQTAQRYLRLKVSQP